MPLCEIKQLLHNVLELIYMLTSSVQATHTQSWFVKLPASIWPYLLDVIISKPHVKDRKIH